MPLILAATGYSVMSLVIVSARPVVPNRALTSSGGSPLPSTESTGRPGVTPQVGWRGTTEVRNRPITPITRGNDVKDTRWLEQAGPRG
jgi:hypothetical protein